MTLAPAIATAIELPTGVGTAPPEWVPLFPAGPAIAANDGREHRLSNPDGVLEWFARRRVALAYDWEHSTEIRAPKGKSAKILSWAKELAKRDDGSIWARVEWTRLGLKKYQDGQLRYVSPAYKYNTQTGEIAFATSAGFTSQPAFVMPAIARSAGEDTDMSLVNIAKRLGLPITALEEDILAKLGENETALARAQTPSLESFVPRADYNAALARATTAEQKIADAQKEEKKKTIDGLIAKAKASGRVTAATESYHRTAMASEGGIAAFEKFIETAPEIAPDSDLDNREAPKSGGPVTKLTELQKAAARDTGVSEEAYLAQLNAKR